jgi:hypothetical protein
LNEYGGSVAHGFVMCSKYQKEETKRQKEVKEKITWPGGESTKRVAVSIA